MSTWKRPSPSGGSRGPRGPGGHRGRGGPGSHRGRAPDGASHGPRSHAKIEPLHPTEIPPDIHDFREWDLGPEVQGAIAAMGIEVPTPIQKLAIGPVLAGRDVIAKAETGTGKTLAFGAPMMAKIDPARASVLGLVLCPTRELAEQVMKVLAKLGEPRSIKVALVVGGEPLGPQVAALKAGSQVVVGTPGRILDLYNQKFLSFPWTEFAILDEADVMLEIGFIDDVKQILSYTPDERQTLLFSATFPTALLELARAHTKDPVEVATASGIATIDAIEQTWMHLDDEDRALALTRLIEQSEPEDVFLVFCDKRTEVDRLMRRLERLPFSLKALHGGYDQEARFRVMSAFRTKEVKALVATDVASRGLDVLHVTHVVNYSAPRDLTDYTHRIGRTGRAGRSGRAITFVTAHGMRYWKRILADKNWPILEVDPPSSTRERPRGGARAPRAQHGEREQRPTHARSGARRWPVDPGAQEFVVEHERQRSGAIDHGRRLDREHGDARPAPLKPHGDPIVEREPTEDEPPERRELSEQRELPDRREHPKQRQRRPERRDRAPERRHLPAGPGAVDERPRKAAPTAQVPGAPHREPHREPRMPSGGAPRDRADKPAVREPAPERSSDAPASRERGENRKPAARARPAQEDHRGRGEQRAEKRGPRRPNAQRERHGERNAGGPPAHRPPDHRPPPRRPSPRRPGGKTDFGTGL